MKVLLITYYYPPMGGAGVQRALKFSKYLPLYGVTPIVITCDDPYYVHDESLAKEIPAGTEIHRISFSPIVSRLIFRFRKRDGLPTIQKSVTKFKLPTRIRQEIRDRALRMLHTLQTPDDANGWARKALKRAKTVIDDHAHRGEPINLIVSSSPPASAHLVAERLAQEFDLPWIADYRDLWTENPAYSLPKWRRAWDVRTENRWLTRAAGLVTVTPTWQRILTARARIPVAMIPNGYDEEDFANIAHSEISSNTFTIVHTGTFYGTRGPETFLEGLASYLSTCQPHPPTGRPKLRVRLIGNMGARFSDVLNNFRIKHPGILEVIPYIPHSEALSELMAADALLLVIGNGDSEVVRGWLPGKIFEYLRTRKPILVVGNREGDAAQLVKHHSYGIVVGNGDKEGLASALDVLVSGRAAPPVADEYSSHVVFERQALACQLACFIRERHAQHLRERMESKLP